MHRARVLGAKGKGLRCQGQGPQARPLAPTAPPPRHHLVEGWMAHLRVDIPLCAVERRPRLCGEGGVTLKSEALFKKTATAPTAAAGAKQVGPVDCQFKNNCLAEM